MERVPCVKYVNSVYQDDRLRDRGKRSIDNNRIQFVLTKISLAAITTLPQPLRETEDKIKPQEFGELGTLSYVIELPRRTARRRRWTPGTLLHWQEQTKDEVFLLYFFQRR